MIRVLVADDHPVVRIGVRQLLESVPDVTVVGEAPDGRDALTQIWNLRPDVLLLDLHMPNLPGLEKLRELADAAFLRTVLLTAQVEDKDILEALQLGARGVVLKTAAHLELADCLRAVAAGGYWLRGRAVTNLVTELEALVRAQRNTPASRIKLTPRELEVVRAVVHGGTNRDIATQLGITEDTVKRHLTNVFDKTGVSSRLELALFALHHLGLTEA